MTPADAARLAEIRDWQPIESAPRDGKEMLLLCDARIEIGCGIFVGWWNKGVWRIDFRHGRYSTLEPTHWMPLPPPPEIPHSDAGGSPEDSAQGEDR